jgi:hypothetical protein
MMSLRPLEQEEDVNGSLLKSDINDLRARVRYESSLVLRSMQIIDEKFTR